MSRKFFKKILVRIQQSAILSKKSAPLSRFEQGFPRYINDDLTRKLNVVNKVLATKEASDYDQRSHLKVPALFEYKVQLWFHLHLQVQFQ